MIDMIDRLVLSESTLVHALNLAIASCVCCGIALAVAYRRKSSLLLRHGVLVSGLVACAVSPLLIMAAATFSVGILPRLESLTWPSAHDNTTAPHDLIQPVAVDEQRIVQREMFVPEPIEFSATTEGLHPLASAQTAVGLSQRHDVARIRGTCLVWVWIAGAMVGCARALLGYRTLRRLLATCSVNHSTDCAAAMQFAASRVNPKRLPTVLRSNLLPTPLVVGVWRPTIILPTGIASRLSAAQLRSVLTHEMAHIRRHDPWVVILQRCAVTLYWWNPLVHLVSRQVTEIREHICDDIATDNVVAVEEYANVLLDVAERIASGAGTPAMLGISLSSKGELERRIRRLLRRVEAPALLGWNRVALAGSLVALASMMLGVVLAQVPTQQEEQATESTEPIDPNRSAGDQPTEIVVQRSSYRMQGVVTDADTGQPVPNAIVRVLITSEPDPARRTLQSQSDDAGRYSIDVPIGNAWAWRLSPPPGYCSLANEGIEQFTTTADEPIYTKNYQLRKGIPIHFAVRFPDNIGDPPKAGVSLSQQEGGELVYGDCELGEDGTGVIYLLEITGTFNVSCGDGTYTLEGPEGMTIRFDDGFDPRNTVEDVLRYGDGTAIVRDANGLTATLQGCDASMNDKQLTITFDVDAVNSKDTLPELTGRIVDTDGAGIEGATVTMSFHSDGGSASSQISATTDDAGQFALRVPPHRASQKIGLIVTHEGYGGIDTEPIQVATSEDGAIDVGTIKLEAGCSIRVRVVGPDGSPLEGAVVEPLNDYASRTQIARTGPNGECTLTDLGPGLMHISTSFGKLADSTKIPLSQGENELIVIKLAPIATANSTDPPAEQPPALQAGTVAPEHERHAGGSR